MTDDQRHPVPEERGQPGPPSGRPPIALGAATPPAPQRGHQSVQPFLMRLRGFVAGMLDFADALVDAVQRELRQRMR